jgi:hypothetical protein
MSRFGYRTRLGLIYDDILSTGFDIDALAFIGAAGITDATQQDAINNLVVGLKLDNIWTKFKALYPFVGGTAITHKFNLKNSLDTNTAFRLTFSGGITHNSNGITGSVNGFANTFLVPSISLTNNSLNVSVYSRTSTQSNSNELGCSTSSFLPIIGLTTRSTLDQMQFDGYDFSAHRLIAAETNGSGFYLGSITSSTSQKIYKNGILKATSISAQTQTQPSVQPIYLLARNDSGTAANYSPKNLSFASIGDGLTDTEALNYYNRVQTFQTALGRQV